MPKYEAGLDSFIATVNGSKLLGGFYRAAGESPRPTAIFAHGVPGVEKNMDLVYALREEGWNALYFHYRGSWGSEGNYNLLQQGDDIKATLAWVLQQPSVDQDHLLLIGSSIGGYNTLYHGAREKRFQYLVSLCPLIDPKECQLPEKVLVQFSNMLCGVTATDLKRQWLELSPILSVIDALRERKLLLLTGDQDEAFPPQHYENFGNALKTMKWIRKEDADHQFSTCRPWLRQTVLTWLKNVVTKN